MDSNSPWNTPTQASKEIQQKQISIDYKQICQQCDVVFFGDFHYNIPIRDHLHASVDILKQAGITHFAVEAAVGTDRYPFDPSTYQQLFLELRTQGIHVVPVDIDQRSNPNPEEREAYITKNIMEILKDEQCIKLAVLIGRFHTCRSNFGNIPSTATRIESKGHSLTRIAFCGGFDFKPTIITDSAKILGLSQKEFMLDLRPYNQDNLGVPFGGDVDYVCHLPQNFTAQAQYACPSY